jgi:hypothetical protein
MQDVCRMLLFAACDCRTLILAARDCPTLLIAAAGFYSIAGMTLYSAHHRKAFIKFFVPQEELKAVLRQGPFRKRDETTFRKSMRTMAGLQALFATIVLGAAVYCLFS